MTFDLTADLVSALSSPAGRAAVAAAVAPVVAAELEIALAARAEQLEPLSAILNIGNDASRKRLKRDPQLRALGVIVGRQWRCKRSVVEGYLAVGGRR